MDWVGSGIKRVTSEGLAMYHPLILLDFAVSRTLVLIGNRELARAIQSLVNSYIYLFSTKPTLFSGEISMLYDANVLQNSFEKKVFLFFRLKIKRQHLQITNSGVCQSFVLNDQVVSICVGRMDGCTTAQSWGREESIFGKS